MARSSSPGPSEDPPGEPSEDDAPAPRGTPVADSSEGDEEIPTPPPPVPVADPAEDVRPSLADREAKTSGEAHPLALLGHLARAPWELPAAWRFTQHGKLALTALRRVAALGPEPFLGRRGQRHVTAGGWWPSDEADV